MWEYSENIPWNIAVPQNNVMDLNNVMCWLIDSLMISLDCQSLLVYTGSNMIWSEISLQMSSNFQPCPMWSTWNIPIKSLGWQCYIDGKFVCPMIEGNHHGTNQSEMHQIWELFHLTIVPFNQRDNFNFSIMGIQLFYFKTWWPLHTWLYLHRWQWITYHYELQTLS